MKLEELQDRLFEVLCTVDDICIKENVRYFLDSGTALGAVREHNFIPWDDDLDIKVLAEDYPAFKAAMEKNLPEHMHIVEPDIFAPGFFDFVVRIYDDRWLLREETEEDRYYKNYQNRVGADIFLVSYVPDSMIGLKMARGIIRFLYVLGMGHRYKIIWSNYTVSQRVFVFLLSRIGKLINVKTIWRKFQVIVSYWSRHPGRYRLRVGSSLLGDGYSEWFSDISTARIRQRDFPVSCGYVKELISMYGEDYMTPKKDFIFFKQHLTNADTSQGGDDK